MGILALILLGVGGFLVATAIELIWRALAELFGPAKGGLDGWLPWLFSQGFAALTVPLGVVGLLLAGVGALMLGMGLLVTSVRRDGDDLICGFSLLRWQLAQHRLPLASVARLSLRVADRSSTGTRERVTLDLIATLRPGIARPTIDGKGLIGRLLARIPRRPDQQPVSVALLCKLTDNDEAKRLVEELSQAWGLPCDSAPQARPDLAAEWEMRQRLER